MLVSKSKTVSYSHSHSGCAKWAHIQYITICIQREFINSWINKRNQKMSKSFSHTHRYEGLVLKVTSIVVRDIKTKKTTNTHKCSVYGLAHPRPCSARGLTNPTDRCMVESDCIYNGIVHSFIANLVETERVVFSPALNTGSQTCVHTFGKRLFLCLVDRKRKLQLKY